MHQFCILLGIVVIEQQPKTALICLLNSFKVLTKNYLDSHGCKVQLLVVARGEQSQGGISSVIAALTVMSADGRQRTGAAKILWG